MGYEEDKKKYTVLELRSICRENNIKGYGKLNKKQLYEKCFKGMQAQNRASRKSPAKVTPPMRKTPPPRKTPVKAASSRSTSKGKGHITKDTFYEKCLASREFGRQCIEKISDRYPDLFSEMCTPVVEGPAAGLVVENNKIIAVATEDGELKAVEGGGIPLPPPPPLPPRDVMPSGAPPPPPIPTLPQIKLQNIPKIKAALKKDIQKSSAAGNTVSKSELQKQLQKLKKVQNIEMKKEPREQDIELSHSLALKQAILTRTSKNADAVRELDKSLRQSSLIRQQQEADKLLADYMNTRKNLKKEVICPKGYIYNPKLQKCVKCSEMNLVWSNKRKQCVDRNVAAASAHEEAMWAIRKRGKSTLKNVQTCSTGSVYSGKVKKCVECSEYGMVYEPSIGKCVIVKGDDIPAEVVNTAVVASMEEVRKNGGEEACMIM